MKARNLIPEQSLCTLYTDLHAFACVDISVWCGGLSLSMRSTPEPYPSPVPSLVTMIFTVPSVAQNMDLNTSRESGKGTGLTWNYLPRARYMSSKSVAV